MVFDRGYSCPSDRGYQRSRKNLHQLEKKIIQRQGSQATGSPGEKKGLTFFLEQKKGLNMVQSWIQAKQAPD
jgi:hypothetical protein